MSIITNIDSSAFKKTTLSNGIRVVTEKIPSVRSVAVGCWIDNGSRHESERLNGISHFVEHMVFKGTTRRRVHHIAQSMESVGGYLNAFTGREHTCFYARALDEHLGRAIDITTDLVFNPSFPEKEIEREKDVVLEEMKMYEDSPEDVIFESFDAALYPRHPLGRPILGSEKTVKSFTRKNLVSFTKSHFSGNRIVISIAGNVEHDQAVRLVEKAMEKGEQPKKGKKKPVIKAIPRYNPKNITRDDTHFHQAHLLVGRRSFGLNNSKKLKLTLLNAVLGGGMSSFLNQNIREKFGYCYNIYSFANMISNTGEFGVYMATDLKKVDQARDLIFKELWKLQQKPLSKNKLKQSKNQMKGSMMLGLESMSNRMMRLGRLELYYNKVTDLDTTLENLDKITDDDLYRLSQDLLKPSRFSVISLTSKP